MRICVEEELRFFKQLRGQGTYAAHAPCTHVDEVGYLNASFIQKGQRTLSIDFTEHVDGKGLAALAVAVPYRPQVVLYAVSAAPPFISGPL